MSGKPPPGQFEDLFRSKDGNKRRVEEDSEENDE